MSFGSNELNRTCYVRYDAMWCDEVMIAMSKYNVQVTTLFSQNIHNAMQNARWRSHWEVFFCFFFSYHLHVNIVNRLTTSVQQKNLNFYFVFVCSSNYIWKFKNTKWEHIRNEWCLSPYINCIISNCPMNMNVARFNWQTRNFHRTSVTSIWYERLTTCSESLFPSVN